MTPSQAFALLKEVSPRFGYKVTVSGVWPETPHTEEANYSAVWVFRRLMYKRWLFLEIAPGVEFPETADYKTNPFVTVKCEIVFGAE